MGRRPKSLRYPHLKMDRVRARVSRGEVKSGAEERRAAHGAPEPARCVERRGFLVLRADLGGRGRERGRGCPTVARYRGKTRFERRDGRPPCRGALQPGLGGVARRVESPESARNSRATTVVVGAAFPAGVDAGGSAGGAGARRARRVPVAAGGPAGAWGRRRGAPLHLTTRSASAPTCWARPVEEATARGVLTRDARADLGELAQLARGVRAAAALRRGRGRAPRRARGPQAAAVDRARERERLVARRRRSRAPRCPGRTSARAVAAASDDVRRATELGGRLRGRDDSAARGRASPTTKEATARGPGHQGRPNVSRVSLLRQRAIGARRRCPQKSPRTHACTGAPSANISFRSGSACMHANPSSRMATATGTPRDRERPPPRHRARRRDRRRHDEREAVDERRGRVEARGARRADPDERDDDERRGRGDDERHAVTAWRHPQEHAHAARREQRHHEPRDEREDRERHPGEAVMVRLRAQHGRRTPRARRARARPTRAPRPRREDRDRRRGCVDRRDRDEAPPRPGWRAA